MHCARATTARSSAMTTPSRAITRWTSGSASTSSRRGSTFPDQRCFTTCPLRIKSRRSVEAGAAMPSGRLGCFCYAPASCRLKSALSSLHIILYTYVKQKYITSMICISPLGIGRSPRQRCRKRGTMAPQLRYRRDTPKRATRWRSDREEGTRGNAVGSDQRTLRRYLDAKPGGIGSRQPARNEICDERVAVRIGGPGTGRIDHPIRLGADSTTFRPRGRSNTRRGSPGVASTIRAALTDRSPDARKSATRAAMSGAMRWRCISQ